MSNKIDIDLIWDKILRAEIKDPNTPEKKKEIAKALLSVSPYSEKKRGKKRKDAKPSAKNK